jgi:divalent metal cation (Fe/Co/Zn/Cd) transporter
LFEDSAAMLGLIVAFVGIFLAQYLGIPALDGVASILIGVILAITAMLLAYETKGLLIGESASPEIVRDIRALIAEAEGVDKLNEIRTLHRGPNDVLLAISIDFKNNITVGKVENTIYKLELAIKERHPDVKRLYIEVQNKRHHAEEVRRAAKAREEENQ